MNDIYAIVGYPISDIGKGWLTAAIASSLKSCLVIKIDPNLNHDDIMEKGNLKNIHKYSSDLPTYSKLGIEISPEQCIEGGNLLFDFLSEKKISLPKSLGECPRYTFADVASYLSTKLINLVKTKKKDKLVIEVGGNINDLEQVYIPSALFKLSDSSKANLRIFLLSYLDYSEDKNFPIKPHHVIQGIQKTRSTYGEPSLVFFRGRKLDTQINKKNLILLKEEISKRASIPVDKLVYVPNFLSPQEAKKYFSKILRLS